MVNLQLDNRYKIIKIETEPYLMVAYVSTPNKSEDGLIHWNRQSVFKLLFCKREPDIIKLVYKKEVKN